MDDDSQYAVEGTKVTLSPTAREFAHEYFPGLSPRQAEEIFARYLIRRQASRQQEEFQ